MLKTLLRITCLNVIPAWLVSAMLLLLLLPSVQNLHSSIANQLAQHSLTVDAPPIRYRLAQVDNDANLTIRWPLRNAKQLSPYFSELSASDYLQDIRLEQPWFAPLLDVNSEKNVQLTQQADYSWWQPAQSAYKTLVHRQAQGSYVDQIVLRDQQTAQIDFSQIETGFMRVPIDPFGGLYLFTQFAPPPQLADAGDLRTFSLNQSNALATSLLDEFWAIEAQAWAVMTWPTLVIAASMMALPWLLLALQTHRFYLSVFAFCLANAVLLWLLFDQLQWFYPLALPIMSALLAGLWFSLLSRKKQRITQLMTQYQQSVQLWISHLLDDGKPEAAFRYLQERRSHTELATLWPMVAAGFERNRQYERSVESYQTYLQLMPNDTPAKQKVKQLQAMVNGTATVAISASSGELPVGQVENLTLGRYQIQSELGRGAMGIVYQAVDPKIHRQVAIKVVHLKSLGLDEVDQVKQRFFREAQAAGKLNHPNIVTVYDVGEEHDVAYIAMDLLLGQSMADKIKNQPENIHTVVRWVAEAAEALAYAHEHDVIHRDVKPANMIIEQKSGRLKLTDFGVARIAGMQQTQTGIVLGSPSYMSPEQIRGEKLTGSTDIFSLGVTLYQALTGQLPFSGETLPALAYGITQTKQESPRNLNAEVPISLVRIVNKALQKSPAERYPSAEAFAASLRKWLGEHQS